MAMDMMPITQLLTGFYLQNPTLIHIPEEIFGFLDVKALQTCRLVSSEWKEFIDNNTNLCRKQLVFGIKHARNRDFFKNNQFNAEQYKAMESMVWIWNSTEIKTALQVIKEVCGLPICLSRYGNGICDPNPLCYATQSNNLCFIKAMAKSQFNFNLKNSNGCKYKRRSRYLPCEFTKVSNLTLMHYACIFGSHKIIDYLAKRLETLDFNAMDTSNFTPLHYACEYGQAEAVKCMLEISYNIDFNAKSNMGGYTPLHFACENGHIEVIKLLLDNSEDKGIEISARDWHGTTPLRIVRYSVERQNDYPKVKEVFEKYLQPCEFEEQTRGIDIPGPFDERQAQDSPVMYLIGCALRVAMCLLAMITLF